MYYINATRRKLNFFPFVSDEYAPEQRDKIMLRVQRAITEEIKGVQATHHRYNTAHLRRIDIAGRGIIEGNISHIQGASSPNDNAGRISVYLRTKEEQPELERTVKHALSRFRI